MTRRPAAPIGRKPKTVRAPGPGVADASPARRPLARRAEAGAARLPRRLLEVDVFAQRLEIVERYGDGAADELARELARLGLATALAFRSPCG